MMTDDRHLAHAVRYSRRHADRSANLENLAAISRSTAGLGLAPMVDKPAPSWRDPAPVRAQRPRRAFRPRSVALVLCMAAAVGVILGAA